MNRLFRPITLSFLVLLASYSISIAQGNWEPYNKVYKKGRITVVTFFAPWSSSSVDLLRKMDGLKWGKPEGVDFDVIGVLVDPKPKLSNKVKEEFRDISMPLVHDQGRLVSEFGYSSSSVGMVVILDKEGGKVYSDHSGNSNVGKDVMTKLTMLSKGTAKPVVKPDTDSLATCAALAAFVKAAETGSFSSLNGLSLPGADGAGKVIKEGYTVYLVTGLTIPDTEDIKSKMKLWSNKIKACLPNFASGETGSAGIGDLLNPPAYKLRPLWHRNGSVEITVLQQAAGDKTNIMLVVSKL